MAKWNFSVVGSSLIKSLDTSGLDVNPRSQSFMQPSVDMVLDKLTFKEGGQYKTSVLFSLIGTIDGDTPTDLQDAYDKLLALIATMSGGGGGTGGSYNTPTVYDTPADLPIEFDANTIHSISMLCLTGTLTVTVNGEETVLSAGENMDIEASTTIDDIISLDSTTGTFKVTTLS